MAKKIISIRSSGHVIAQISWLKYAHPNNNMLFFAQSDHDERLSITSNPK